MNCKGKLTKVLDIQTGTSKAGKEWKKQNFVIDTGDQFNPEVCFQVFGDDKIKMLSQFKEGDNLDVSFNLSSREFNGKYYHNVDAWSIKKVEAVVDNSPVEEDSGLPF